jgi:hypothetical protein
VDAGAALQLSEIDVELGEWIYTIPALPASAWMEAILDEDGGSIVPGLMDEATQADIWREFLRGHISQDELRDAWRGAIGAASGQPWWQCARLVMAAASPDSWPIVHGKLIAEGVRIDQISLGALYNALYYLCLKACADDNDRTAFEFNLTSPPPEVSVEEAMEETNAEDDWMAAFSSFQQFGSG